MMHKAYKYKDNIAVMEPAVRVLNRISTGLGCMTIEYARAVSKQGDLRDISGIYYTSLDEKIDREYGIYDKNPISSEEIGKERVKADNDSDGEEIWETAQHEAEDLMSTVLNGVCKRCTNEKQRL